MKKGFTLIELLAVIVILAIIALIVTPVISNIIKTVKLNVLKSSAYGLIDAARLYSIQYRPENQVRFDIVDNEIITIEENKLKYTGNAGNGTLVIEPNMKVAVCLTDGVNSAYKDTNENEVSLVRDKVCDIGYGTSFVNLYETKILTDLVLDTVDMMKKNTSIASGQTIQTKGFYESSDGGGAFYEILDNLTNDDVTTFALDNGLYAKLIVQHKMSVKQFGALGIDTDDHLAFDYAISSGANEIYIPAGTYEINDIIHINKFIKLIGSGESKTILKNSSFESKYGISAYGITFDGGVMQHIDYVGTHALDEDGTVVFVVTPNSEVDVTYKNCTFKNVTIASFARDENDIPVGSKIKNNAVDSCTFENIGKLAIYHSLTLDNGIYTNNSFTNLGSTDIFKGFVSALMIGDITNNTRKEAKNIVIKDSTFTNLMTQNDLDPDSVHVINANFIAIKADKAVIDNNNVTDLIGYGNDREGIYTKVRDLTISNNRLTNAGLGEGYICAKAHEGKVFNTIKNNTFNGTAGRAIRNYGPGLIEGNTINIQNVPTAFINTLSPTIDSTGSDLTIKGNIFSVGTFETLNLGDTVINEYNKDKEKVISLSDVSIPITIENNIINTITNFGHYISIGNPGESIQIKNNSFNLSDKSGKGIFIFNNNKNNGYINSLNNNTVISGNHFDIGEGFDVARYNLKQDSGETSYRTISFIGNDIKYNGTNIVYALIDYALEENEDRLIISGNACNMPKSKTYVVYQTKYFDVEDTDFAKYTKKAF